jgi:hypothetical protein
LRLNGFSGGDRGYFVGSHPGDSSLYKVDVAWGGFVEVLGRCFAEGSQFGRWGVRGCGEKTAS